MGLFSKVLSAGSGKQIKKYGKTVAEINELENEFSKLSDDELSAKTTEFKQRIANGENIDSVLPEAFANVREAGKRTIGQRLYDVQLMASMALNDGNVIEAKTGEGKRIADSQQVLTPFGAKPASELRVGDKVLDVTGRPVDILGIYGIGPAEVYKVEFEDASFDECSEDHLWGCYEPYNGKNRGYIVEGRPSALHIPAPSNTTEYGVWDSIANIMKKQALSNDNRIIFCFNSKDDAIGMASALDTVGIASELRCDVSPGNVVCDQNGSEWTVTGASRSVFFLENENGNIEIPLADLWDSFRISGGFGIVERTTCEMQRRMEDENDGDSYMFHVPCIRNGIAVPGGLGIASISKTGHVEGMRCFYVDSPFHMFLLDNGVATHNTYACVPASYLNALAGNNVHIVTVNEYLAKRDAENMGKVYEALGMTTGYIYNQQPQSEKTNAYACDITYGTPSEFGFDYLRDNMVTKLEDRVQRGRDFAIVDEADSILIDEARTPLIISGVAIQAADMYRAFARAVPSLREGEDFEMDEKMHQIYCTEIGLAKIETALGIEDIYDDPSGALPNHLQQALKAQFMFHRDKDYVVQDGEIKIVDEFTGRIMEGRRWSEGLHQAIEAKEHVAVKDENQTIASVTLQNYFRLYQKLAGMTGTALSADGELRSTYHVGVVEIPTNKPMIRIDDEDVVYRNEKAKYNAVADEIECRNAKGQPCLVGTISVENSEKLSRILSKRGISHQVLNAKNNEHEAGIVAQAGRLGAITIATNMAGRGTDIILGGNVDGMVAEAKKRWHAENDIKNENGVAVLDVPEDIENSMRIEAQRIFDEEHQKVIDAGGLAVIGTERHDSRRIDDQLRGRSGRQGDPGHSQFYISLEDDLMRMFGGDRMDSIGSMMEKSGMSADVPLRAKMVSKAIERAQTSAEGMNAETRKHILEYDDVMNKQRMAIYEERNAVLEDRNIKEKIEGIISDTVDKNVIAYCNPKNPSDDWDWNGLQHWYDELTGISTEDLKTIECDDDVDELIETITDKIQLLYLKKEEMFGAQILHQIERQVMLRVIDTNWMMHLADMDALKAGIGLRGYGQRDPLTEYQADAYAAFGVLVETMFDNYLKTILRIHPAVSESHSEEVQIAAPANAPKLSYSQPQEPIGDLRRDLAKRRAANIGVSGVTPGDPVEGVSTPSSNYVRDANAPRTLLKDKDDLYANVGRNDPCPCGSGKKFKKCHGAPKTL